MEYSNLILLRYTYETLAMSKRVRAEEALEDAPPSKRARPSSVDRLSKLSDELILRVLSYLSVSQLVVCQRYAFVFVLYIASSEQRAE